MTQRRIAAATLGCKVNMYDTEAMLGLFEEKGYKIVGFEEVADIYIVNTCTVTNLGDRKSRQMIRRARKKNSDAIIVATGCYAQVAPEEVAAIEGVNLITGVKDRKKIVELIENYKPDTDAAKNVSGVNVSDINVSNIREEKEFEELAVKNLRGRTRAFLKIQEGCDRFCTYCIIPYARGPVRSRKPEDIIKEVKDLAENGFKEIVLSGIHVGSYGKDLGDIDLSGLIKKVHDISGSNGINGANEIERIRLSSIDPLAVTESFVREISNLPKICEHFHLSLQSGCDRTLKRMNRRYTSAEYEAAADRLRTGFDDVALTTDVIVGFPGESPDDFDESYSFVKRMGFSRLHVFPYSPKRGTPAAGFPQQVPPIDKDGRCKKMIALGDEMANDFLKKHSGKKMEVLFERCVNKNVYEGHTRNYITIRMASPEDITNKIVVATVDDNAKYLEI